MLKAIVLFVAMFLVPSGYAAVVFASEKGEKALSSPHYIVIVSPNTPTIMGASTAVFPSKEACDEAAKTILAVSQEKSKKNLWKNLWKNPQQPYIACYPVQQ